MGLKGHLIGISLIAQLMISVVGKGLLCRLVEFQIRDTLKVFEVAGH